MGSKGRRDIRVERGSAALGDPLGPIVLPLEVGSIGDMARGGFDQQPAAMTITLEVDNVPGLSKALDEQMAGRAFDIVTRWHTAVPDDTTHSPLAFLDLHLPEIDLGLHIGFEVDEYKRSLMVAARTGRAMIFEPALGQALRTQPMELALEQHRSMGFELSDPEPLRQVLLQRFDLPLTPYPSEPTRQIDDPKEATEHAPDFMAEAAPASLEAIVTVPGGQPIIVISDPDAELPEADKGPEPHPGRWAVARTDIGPVARLDRVAADTKIDSWLLMSVPQEMVRAASSGAHAVVVISETLSKDREVATSQMQQGLIIAIEEASAAMRSALA